MLWFGIESYAKNLKYSKERDHRRAEYKAIKLCQKHGLMVLEQMMVGNQRVA